MFGIMKKRCGESCDLDRKTHRVHYCGTCKSMGKLYGQKSRLLLNFDAVFLAELISITSEEKINDWQETYRTPNCLSSVDEELIPFPLWYSSSVNILLTELKIKDHKVDDASLMWKGLDKLFKNSFLKAKNNLIQVGLDVDGIIKCSEKQFVIEQGEKSLFEYAEPTAKITALIFENAAKNINSDQEIFFDIGFNFGFLAYLLDAFEDFEKDRNENKFNAIASAYLINELQGENKKRIVFEIHRLRTKIQAKIQELNIPEINKKEFISRLTLNVFQKINGIGEINADIDKSTYSWTESKEEAKVILSLREKEPIKRKVQAAVFSSVIFLHPETVETLKSIDASQIGAVALMATFFSSLACFAKGKKNKIKRKLKRIRRWKKCVDCGGADCCECFCSNCCDFCFESEIFGKCCTDCRDECKRDLSDLAWALLWVSVALLILIIIILVGIYVV